MSDIRIDPKDTKFYIQARLGCEAVLEIFQRAPAMPWEFIVTPKPGTNPEDFCSIKDGVVHITMLEGSAIGLLQLLYMCAGAKFDRKRKKLFGIF